MAQLLTAPSAQLAQALAAAHKSIATAFPLKGAHRNELPYAVRDLSRLLTQERGQSQGYWAHPRFVGAYLYYFLPWNLQRLAWLLPGLPIELQEGDQIMDLGSGPLTLPMGIWLCRPDLRALKLQLICADTAPRPMELGRAILDGLAAAQAQTPWQTSLLRGPLDVALRKAKGKMRLIMAGNVLNELQAPRRSTLDDKLEDVLLSMGRLLSPGGQILLMEPGTRLGGKLVGLMRQKALEHGFTVESPCPHSAPCPFVAQSKTEEEPDEQKPAPRMAAKGQRQERAHSGWCHFNIPSGEGTPELAALTREAKLEKERLSLACLLLRKEGQAPKADCYKEKTPQHLPVRVISDLIRLPDQPAARYACSAQGLVLLQHAAKLGSGELVEAWLPADAKKDHKSGALLAQIKR